MKRKQCDWAKAWFVSLAALPLLPAAIAAQAPEYAIKADDAPIGSHIRGEAAHSSILPINRSYEQLTNEERAIVNGWYEDMAPGDEPPFPREGTKPIIDAVRKAQEKLLASGKLFLVATVEPNGRASAVKVLRTPSAEMAKFAGSVLLLTKFKPAICGGRACRMDFPMWYDLQVK
jgi:hypothetical protein